MIDPIERQAAIDAIYKCTDIYINNLPTMIDKAETYKAISELPSAQPEIVYCKDCKFCVPGYITDNDDFIPPRCGRLRQTMRISGDDYCSFGKRRTDEENLGESRNES